MVLHPLLPGGLRPPDPLTRALARRFDGSLRTRGSRRSRSLAMFRRSVRDVIPLDLLADSMLQRLSRGPIRIRVSAQSASRNRVSRTAPVRPTGRAAGDLADFRGCCGTGPAAGRCRRGKSDKNVGVFGTVRHRRRFATRVSPERFARRRRSGRSAFAKARASVRPCRARRSGCCTPARPAARTRDRRQSRPSAPL